MSLQSFIEKALLRCSARIGVCGFHPTTVLVNASSPPMAWAEENFRKDAGLGWALCDGRNVEGSRYEALGYGQCVPNCSGLFLRSFGGNSAALGEIQEQGTASNALAVKSSLKGEAKGFGEVVAKTDVSHADLKLWEVRRHRDDNDRGVATYHQHEGAFKKGGDADAVELSRDTGNQEIFKDSGHFHRLKSDVSVLVDLSKVVIQSQITSQDTETRPRNISVNTFIRIN